MYDYKNLCQQLIKLFPQLVIFDLKEISGDEMLTYKDRATIHDLSGDCERKKYLLGSYQYKPLIIILPMYPTGDIYHDYLQEIFNLYCVIVKNQSNFTNFFQMSKLAEKLTDVDKQINWIWFREKNFKLPNKIMNRANSWIILNPSFKFTLWTNLKNTDELNDFISELNSENKQYFTCGKITVKYQSDIENCIQQFCLLNSDKIKDSVTILKHLYFQNEIETKTDIQTIFTTTQTVTTSTVTTHTPNNYKINRIFKVDLLRIIILSLYGGVYCDFNDTICFYPLEYLLPLYIGDYFIGTDYDIEHPVFRNNFFIYSSFENKQFFNMTIKCINQATREYIRITDNSYIRQFVDLTDKILSNIETKTSISGNELTILNNIIDNQSIRQSIENLIKTDTHKTVTRILLMVCEIIQYFEKYIPSLKSVGDRLNQELDNVAVNQLDIYIVRRKMMRRRRTQYITLDSVIDINKMFISNLKYCDTYDFHEYFLMKYAIHMTTGDLILSTNIAFISDFKNEHLNLVPFSRLNRLSTISMITHIYDGTSYGLDKNYNILPNSYNSYDISNNIRIDLL